MRRFKNSLLLLFVAAALVAQQPTPLVDPEVRRIGEQLRCMCGSCNYTITSCNMMSCSGAEYGREKLRELVDQGLSDENIKAVFVAEFGQVVLTKPTTEGFNLVGWVMPFAALFGGLLVIWWFLKRFVRTPVVERADDSLLEQYRDRIEKDLSEND
jgi:cytochrome c-type biogenesis protein CcmH